MKKYIKNIIENCEYSCSFENLNSFSQERGKKVHPLNDQPDHFLVEISCDLCGKKFKTKEYNKVKYRIK